MDWLRRCAPVIAVTITAGPLCVGVGLAMGPTASADDSSTGASADGSGPVRRDSGPRLPRPAARSATPAAPDTPSGSAGPVGPALGAHWPDEGCIWPWPWPPDPPVIPDELYPVRENRGIDNLIGAIDTVVPMPPVPTVEQGIALDVPVDISAEPPTPSAAAAAPPGGTSAPVSAGAPPVSVWHPPVAPVPAPPASLVQQRPTATARPPAAPTPTPTPVAAALLPPTPAGLPVVVSEVELAALITIVLPGLGAMAGMTLFGGLIGYRQAKAGYALPTAGAGRFLS